MARKKELLRAIYTVYSRWVERIPLACHRGCAACCTQSVTMTTLEGEVILHFVKKTAREKWLREKLAPVVPGKSREAISMNQFAEACLNHREIDGDIPGSWDFAPCIFLEEEYCSIYEVRPFGCRSFGSFVQCAADRSAEMAPIHLTVNTVFTQIIEHVSSDGGYWGNMANILEDLVENETPDATMVLRPAQPIPGFLLEPYEAKLIHVLLKQLYEQSVEKQTFGDLIDNFISI